MLKNQRHEEIMELLKAEKFVSVSDLSRRLYASQPTIRRDLGYLERQGLIRRSHGGAIPADDKGNIPVSFRSGTHMAEKLRICRTAASLVSPGALIFTDASTTALHIADCLRGRDGITAVTNSLLACKRFLDNGVRVFSTGGRLLRDSLAFVGETARTNAGRYNADVMFFSASSLGEDGMISDYSDEETELRLSMAEHTRCRVFLCDSAKFGSHSAFNLFPLTDVDFAVTGAPLPPEILEHSGMRLRSADEACLYEKISE